MANAVAASSSPRPRLTGASSSLACGSRSTSSRPGSTRQALPGEAPARLALRLALAKADAVAARHPAAVVVGSDQVADLDGRGLGKPGDHDRATAQLRAMRGRVVVFQTAVAVVCRDAVSPSRRWCR